VDSKQRKRESYNQIEQHGHACQGEYLVSIHTGSRLRNRREEEVARPVRGSASGAERSETERSETARKSRASAAAGSAMRRGQRWWWPCG